MQGVGRQDVAAIRLPPVAEAAPGCVVGGGVGGPAVPDDGHGAGRGAATEEQQQHEDEPTAVEGHR